MNMLKKYLSQLSNENFNRNRAMVNRENQIGLDLIVIATIVFLAINIVLRLLLGHQLIHSSTLALEIVYFVFVFILYNGILRKKNLNFTLGIYFFEEPVLLIAMFDAVYYEPNQTTFIFMVFLFVFPIFVLDKPWHIYIFIGQNAAVYAIVAYIVEPLGIYAMDMVHLIDVSLLAVGSCTFFATVRMRMIQYANHNATLAEEDPLTGLYNRSGARHHVQPGEPGIFVYIDLDKFKGVNDEFGHAQGDRVLQETAEALQANFRKNDIIIRLGGDEFAVFSPGKWTYKNVQDKMNALLQSIREMKMADDTEYMTASIGCAYAPHGCKSLDELTRMADNAMYEAKKAGKNGFRIVTV